MRTPCTASSGSSVSWRISHTPNLVRLHELFCYADRWYFTMDLIRGVHFIDYVRPGIRVAHDAPTVDGELLPMLDSSSSIGGSVVDERKLRRALFQLTEGVGALHQAGKLHRDLKPQNVLVDEDGRVVVLDFGLLDDIGGDARDSDGRYEIVGTPAYMAPEAASGQRDGTESDWYSVGVMLYEALTGQLPFDGKPNSMLLRKQTTDPVDPAPLVATSMLDLARLSVTLLSRNPDGRPSFESLRASLQARVSQVLVGAYDSAAARRESDPSLFLVRQPTEFLIGRDALIQEMAAAFEKVANGDGALLRVSGRSGMGKTALVRCFVEELRKSRRAVALLGRCYETESVPYKALDSLVDALTQTLMSLPSDEVATLLPSDLVPLTKLFPVLRRVRLIADADTDVDMDQVDPQEVRRAAFSSLRALLRRLAARTALGLVDRRSAVGRRGQRGVSGQPPSATGRAELVACGELPVGGRGDESDSPCVVDFPGEGRVPAAGDRGWAAQTGRLRAVGLFVGERGRRQGEPATGGHCEGVRGQSLVLDAVGPACVPSGRCESAGRGSAGATG